MNLADYNTGGSYACARHGEQCATKLTQEQASAILKRRQAAQRYMAEAKKLSNTALADKFGITHKAVGRIINGHRWRTGSGKSRYGVIVAHDAFLMREAARERDRLKSLAANHSIKVLAEEYGVSENMIEAIGNGRRWVYLEVE